MDYIKLAMDIFFHLDTYLNTWAGIMGPGLYVLLFCVIFAETGLVITPFLPGDSLLFAVGALAAISGSPINVVAIVITLNLAAILGDTCNYSIGYRVGPKVFNREKSLFLNKKHLIRAQGFYEKYGSKTIVLCKYVPIVRTFAPFVAGVGKMKYKKFFAFNVIGSTSWVNIFVWAGYFFGNQPWVKSQFHYVIVAIIIISVLPAVIEISREYFKKSPITSE